MSTQESEPEKVCGTLTYGCGEPCSQDGIYHNGAYWCQDCVTQALDALANGVIV